jgi:hypothetical protein
MSTKGKHLTVAEMARRAAENIYRIAAAATGDQPAASQFDSPMQLRDSIGYDMFQVLEWVERRRGPETAAALRKQLRAILHGMDKAPQKTPSGNLILDLFGKARTLAFSLRNWANDIDAEESQGPRVPAKQIMALPALAAQSQGKQTPPEYLTCWREILGALHLANNSTNQAKVRNFIKHYGGPIKLPQKGGQPKVTKDKLLEWWNQLETRWSTSGEGMNSAATLEDQHNYGKTGTVVPQISGHVKKRRKRSE